MPSLRILLPALVAAPLWWAVPAFGQTITQTEIFGPSVPPFGSLLTFDTYTGDLSHLLSVEVIWTMSISDGYLVIDNDAVGAANGSYEFGAQIALDQGNTTVTLLDAGFSPIFSSTQVINSGTFSLAGNVGDAGSDYDATGPDGVGITGQAESNSGGGAINDLFLAQFVSGPGGSGGSTFDIAIQNQQYLNVTSNGGTEYAINPVIASGSVTVTYHFIPEPATALLSGLGLLALLLRRRP